MESNLSNAVVKRPFLITTVCLSVLGATTLVWTIFGSLKLESTGIGVILRGKHFVTISARTSGVIKRQYFELNDEVNEGQIVLSMASEIDKIRLEYLTSQKSHIQVNLALCACNKDTFSCTFYKKSLKRRTTQI